MKLETLKEDKAVWGVSRKASICEEGVGPARNGAGQHLDLRLCSIQNVRSKLLLF